MVVKETLNICQSRLGCSPCRHISQKMRITKDAPDFLGDPGRFVFNYTLINSVLEAMTPENMVGFLGTHHVNFSSSGLGPEDSDAPDGPPEQDSSSVAFPWPDLDQLEPIYSTPYTEMDIPTELLSYWGDLTPVSDDLFLQETNDFIPRDFGILPPPPNPSDTPAKVDGEYLTLSFLTLTLICMYGIIIV